MQACSQYRENIFRKNLCSECLRPRSEHTTTTATTAATTTETTAAAETTTPPSKTRSAPAAATPVVATPVELATTTTTTTKTTPVEVAAAKKDAPPKTVPAERNASTPTVTRTEPAIRIFLSSTFDDQGEERNYLQKTIFPRVTAYCKQHGWTFQVVDLRWGIRNESTDDHRTVDICMTELRRCQEVSPNCHFIVLLGNRYGWRPPAAKITQADFDLLLDAMGSADDKETMHKWYMLDENVIPPLYRLRTLNDENRSVFWGGEAAKVTKLIHDAADILNERGQLAAMSYKLYTASVTELEVLNGIFESAGAEHHALAFLRDIDGLKENDPNAYRYANMIKNEQGQFTLDQEAWRLQTELKERVRRTLPPEHVFNYSAQWTGSGMTTDHVETLAHDLERSLRSLIDGEMARFQPLDALQREIRAHEDSFSPRLLDFVGREAELQQIEEYLSWHPEPGQDGHLGVPLIVSSPLGAGVGKTYLLTKALADFRGKKENSHVQVIPRLVGASASSTSTVSLLTSILLQMESYAIANGVPGAETSMKEIEKRCEDELQDAAKLFTYWNTRLESLSSEAHPLVLVLCGVDDLAATESGPSADWLPKRLPPFVRILLSVNDSSALSKLRWHYNTAALASDGGSNDKDESALKKPLPGEIELGLLSPQNVHDLVRQLLSSHKRAITPEQHEFLSSKLVANPHPLYVVTAVLSGGLSWSSSQDVSSLVIGSTYEECVKNDLDRLEKYHGMLLTRHVLSYICLARYGLSDRELLDILSTDSVVLNDIFQYHKPDPIQLPDIVWSRLHRDLEHYLKRRESHQVELFVFKHSSMDKVIREFYASDREFCLEILRKSSEFFFQQSFYFDGKEGSGAADNAKDSVDSDSSSGTATEGSEEGENRLVPTPASGQATTPGASVQVAAPLQFNFRKCAELVHHLIGAERWDDVQSLLTSMEYMTEISNRFGPAYYMSDLRNALKAGKNAGVPLDDIHELCILLMPKDVIQVYFLSPSRWKFCRIPPWRAVPPSGNQASDALRQRGTPCIHFKVGSGWYFFGARYPAMTFPPIPHLWSEKPSAARYMDPPPSAAGGIKPPGNPMMNKPPMPGAQVQQQNHSAFEAPLPLIVQRFLMLRVAMGISVHFYSTS